MSVDRYDFLKQGTFIHY